jgi:hypothetical protein
MSSSDEEFQADRLYEDSDAQPEPDPVTDEDEFCEIEPPLEASTPSVAPGGGRTKLQGYTFLDNKTIPIEVSTSDVDTELLQTARKEINAVSERLLHQLNKPNPTLADIFLHHVDSLFRHVKKHSQLSRRELLLATVVKCGEIRYGAPASELLSPDHDGDFHPSFLVMKEKELHAIIKKIQISREVKVADSWDADAVGASSITALERIISDEFRPYQVKGITVLVLDDDKLRKRSDAFRKFGFKQTDTKNSGKCPVMHMIVSLTTGIPLSVRIDRPGTKHVLYSADNDAY